MGHLGPRQECDVDHNLNVGTPAVYCLLNIPPYCRYKDMFFCLYLGVLKQIVAVLTVWGKKKTANELHPSLR